MSASPPYVSRYQLTHSLDERIAAARVLWQKHPNTICVVCEPPWDTAPVMFHAPQEWGALPRSSAYKGSNVLPSKEDRTTIAPPSIAAEGEIHKLVLQSTSSAGQLVRFLRDRLAIDASRALFLFTSSGSALPNAANIKDLWQKYKHEDGLLYLWYVVENTFGCEER